MISWSREAVELWRVYCHGCNVVLQRFRRLGQLLAPICSWEPLLGKVTPQGLLMCRDEARHLLLHAFQVESHDLVIYLLTIVIGNLLTHWLLPLAVLSCQFLAEVVVDCSEIGVYRWIVQVVYDWDSLGSWLVSICFNTLRFTEDIWTYFLHPAKDSTSKVHVSQNRCTGTDFFDVSFCIICIHRDSAIP